MIRLATSRKIGLLVAFFSACSIQADAAIRLQSIANGLASPLYVTSAGDSSGRLFIVEQAGRIRIFSGSALVSIPFLDIRSQVRSGGETGLLGLAFHPSYGSNGRFFVNYTRNGPSGLESVISEFRVSGNPNVADRTSERILLTYSQPFDNHKGGMLAFGPDGYLYVGTGDGGSGGDPFGNGQSLNTLLGKMLRIDVDSASPYGIPPDNPFVGRPGLDEIFAYGLRNPWRFAFDRVSDRLIAADVGQDSYEEIDIIERGGNYGWNIMEGTHCYSPPSNCNTTGLILPIYNYDHSLGSSITGGFVYRGLGVPSLAGKYLYSDFGSGTLWALTELATGQWRNEVLLETGRNISSFGEDESGELYLVDYGGSVFKIVSDGQEPIANQLGVVNAASFLAGPVAPGEIVSIFGTGLATAEARGAQLDPSGWLTRSLAGTTVWFDEIAAPLFYAQRNQINAQVPYEMAGRSSVVVQVQYQNLWSNPLRVPVASTAPGIFALSSGAGQGAILNADLSLNSAANPAGRGSAVVIFATGEGQTQPPGEDGKLSTPPYPAPAAAVDISIGGLAAATEFVGEAPGFAGLLQINARIPTSIVPGTTVPVTLHIGDRSAQDGLTLAVN